MSPDMQFSAWFREHNGAVYRYIAACFGLEQDAEEVTQEAFMRMHVALLAREPIESPRAWAMTVARHLMLDRLRHRRHVQQHPVTPDIIEATLDPGLSPEEALFERRKRAAVQCAVRQLSPLEQQVMCARASGLKLREIGQVVDLDLRRVAEVVTRAVSKLQQNLRE